MHRGLFEVMLVHVLVQLSRNKYLKVKQVGFQPEKNVMIQLVQSQCVDKFLGIQECVECFTFHYSLLTVYLFHIHLRSWS